MVPGTPVFRAKRREQPVEPFVDLAELVAELLPAIVAVFLEGCYMTSTSKTLSSRGRRALRTTRSTQVSTDRSVIT
jgi:hypothetical protein